MCKLNIECARQVKLRAHLYRKGDIGSLDNKLETHRINLEGKESTLFRKLQIALIKECKGLGLEEGSFQIYWDDGSADLIVIENAHGFQVAIEETQGPVHNIIVLLENNKYKGKFGVIFQVYLLCTPFSKAVVKTI